MRGSQAGRTTKFMATRRMMMVKNKINISTWITGANSRRALLQVRVRQVRGAREVGRVRGGRTVSGVSKSHQKTASRNRPVATQARYPLQPLKKGEP